MKKTYLQSPNWKKIAFLLLFCICVTNGYYKVESHSVTYNYDRIDEVKKKCGSVLESVLELKPDDNRVYSIKEDLSFVNGDWWQNGNNEAPLMPFDTRDSQTNTLLDSPLPLKLASFWVTDVSRSQRSKKYLGVSGILKIGLTSGGLFDQKPDEVRPTFDIWPGHSQLTVIFQGVYMETSERKGESEGERVMCLLGETKLPSRYPDPSDPWEWVRESGFTNQPPLVQDEQILLILNYPKMFSLANRAIRGSFSSLNPKSNLKYFDEVHISSSIGALANYEFGSKFISETCSRPSYEDTLMGHEIEVYKQTDLCSMLQRLFFDKEGITIVPNWSCSGTDEFCSKLGPFSSDSNINATDGGFKDVRLVLQDVRCKVESLAKNGQFSKVSLVFRVIEPLENTYDATQRTGINNMTLSAEGIWNYTNGKLCMIGCLGLSNECNTRIVLYIPLSFSIKQRSIVVGTISSTKVNNLPYFDYFPLSFKKIVTHPAELWDQTTTSRPYYIYSKIDSAISVMEKNEPFSVGTVIKSSLLKYPKVDKTETVLAGLYSLSEDLALGTLAYPDPVSTTSSPPRTNVQLEIVALGSLFGPYWSSQYGTVETAYEPRLEYTEKELLVNVSAQLTLTTKPDNNVTVVFLEGLYDERVGNMYLIGCVDVRASWKLLRDSNDLENGLDCLVEVVITYPPTTARGLVSPTASVSLSSQRTEDNPFYFKPIKLKTFPLMYRRQREDILSRRGIEGILRILTLSVAIACILSQLFYIRNNLESVPFISLVMLGVQAMGYSLPLITGAEAIYKKMGSDYNLGSESYESQEYAFGKNQWICVIDYIVKLLVLVAFLITIRLCQKVYKSRIRLLTRTPLEPHRVPSDKIVLLIFSVVHIIGYILVIFIHSLRTSQRPTKTHKFEDYDGNSKTTWEWKTELEEYIGLVQDFFLFPQIIGNFMWQIDTKPLRKFYFMGLTSVRVLPHIYDIIKSPIANPYFSVEYDFVNPRYGFYSKFGDIAILVTAILLAIIVYVQQRWKYKKLRETITIGNRKLLPLGSKVYERLPSQSFEAELVSGAKDDNTQRKYDD